MTSCRGVIIAGATNTARTQMAEGLLRAFTKGSLFVCSGGWQHGGGTHPLAVRAMADVGLPIGAQQSSSLEGARRQRATYDVYVSIDDPYTNRSSDRYAARAPSGEAGASASSSAGFSDPLLASAIPAHWAVARDTADGRQSWTLWSPRDPSIFHENSTRKLQDHLYEGEPLFMQVRPSELRRACRQQRRWEVSAVAERYAMETVGEQFARVVAARTSLVPLCIELLRDLEATYGETLVDEAAVSAYREAVGAAGGAAAVPSAKGLWGSATPSNEHA